MSAFIVEAKDVDRDFLFYVFQEKSLGALVSSTALPAISSNDLRSIEVDLPKLRKEQRAIAAALKDADELVSTLQAVINKKRDLKVGAMQDLLSGRRRLPGFSAEWTQYNLGTRGTFTKGSGIKKDEVQSGDLPCVRYGELYTIHGDIVRIFPSRISAFVAATAKEVARGDILFAGSGETKEEIGKCSAVMADCPVYAGGDIIVFRPREDDPAFLARLLNVHDAQVQKSRKGQGDAVVHIGASALASIEMNLPDPEEQRAIAAVIEDMEQEIIALNQRLQKARRMKEGMMQDLLTGRVRLGPMSTAVRTVEAAE